MKRLDYKQIMKKKKVHDIFAFVPHGLLPFSILAFSYNGFVKFSFHSDKTNGPKVNKMVLCLEQEIEEVFGKYNL